MRISDWSSDVCSSDLAIEHDLEAHALFLRASPGDPVQALRIGRPWSNEMRRHAQLAIGPAHLPHEVCKRSIGHACGRRIGGRPQTLMTNDRDEARAAHPHRVGGAAKATETPTLYVTSSTQ